MNDSMHTSTYAARRDPARITPELALVDPDLASRVRKWLPTGRTGRKPPLPALRHASRASAEAPEATPRTN
jgi:hypothetical protein